MVPAQLHGYHVYRLKGRLHACISPSENGLINGKILTGLTDSQLENLDMIEGSEYVRKTVEVVLTDTSEKKQVETYVWANKDDPNLYGEWDFEEWRRLHMDKFIEASTKFIEWKKNPDVIGVLFVVKATNNRAYQKLGLRLLHPYLLFSPSLRPNQIISQFR
jgi:gamma-glutamylcyclotransferase (GGCT)/AIG2-like uncharacterized protein YtfP